MQVIFHLPRGYEAEITQAKADNIYAEWIDSKFGTMVRELISEDFNLAVDEGFFTVNFTYEDDALSFLKTFGGRAVSND